MVHVTGVIESQKNTKMASLTHSGLQSRLGFEIISIETCQILKQRCFFSVIFQSLSEFFVDSLVHFISVIFWVQRM